MSALGQSPLRERHTQCLIALLKLEFAPRADDEFRSLLTQSLDWPLLVRTARKHGVLTLVYKTLRRLKPCGLPEPVLEDLAAHYRQNAARNLSLFAELQDLLHRFSNQDIPVLPFKGPVLALTAYGDLSLRQFTDLDLLIREDRIKAARKLLHHAGYRPVASNQLAWSSVFQHEDRGTAVDLQWAFGDPRFVFPIDFERLWLHARPLELKGQSILQPALEDQLLILAGHGGKHCWSRLGWVCDFAAFTRAVDPHIDWSAALRHAEVLGGRRLLLLACALAEALLGSTLPPLVHRRIESERRMRQLLEVSGQNLFAPDHSPTWAHGGLDFNGLCRYYLTARERLRDRYPVLRVWARHHLRRSLKANR